MYLFSFETFLSLMYYFLRGEPKQHTALGMQLSTGLFVYFLVLYSFPSSSSFLSF